MRARTAALTLTTIALALTGCSKAAPAPSAPSTTPIEVTRAQAYKAAEQSIRTWQAVDAGRPRTLKGTKAEKVVTPTFIKDQEETWQEIFGDGTHVTGPKNRIKNITPKGFTITPAPRTVMQACILSAERFIAPNGQDLTVDVHGKPVPPGDAAVPMLVTLVPSLTGDGTWLIDRADTQDGTC